MPEAGLRPAQVVWHSDDLFGCQFERPIAKGAVSAALLRSPALPAETAVEPLGAEPNTYLARRPDVDSVGVERLPIRTRFFVIVGLSIASWAIVGIPVALFAF